MPFPMNHFGSQNCDIAVITFLFTFSFKINKDVVFLENASKLPHMYKQYLVLTEKVRTMAFVRYGHCNPPL